jgi:predicted nucleic acid-binding protein
LRARHAFRTPDAIHVAAALAGNCAIFLTNDYRLNRAVGITVQVIEATRADR